MTSHVGVDRVGGVNPSTESAKVIGPDGVLNVHGPLNVFQHALELRQVLLGTLGHPCAEKKRSLIVRMERSTSPT